MKEYESALRNQKPLAPDPDSQQKYKLTLEWIGAVAEEIEKL